MRLAAQRGASASAARGAAPAAAARLRSGGAASRGGPQHPLRRRGRGAPTTTVAAGAVGPVAAPSGLRLLRPTAPAAAPGDGDADAAGAPRRRMLVYFPGTDGTGEALAPQLESLSAAGIDVRVLYMPPSDRSSWAALTDAATALLAACSARHGQAILLGESFGGCLALRRVLLAPIFPASVICCSLCTLRQRFTFILAAASQRRRRARPPKPRRKPRRVAAAAPGLLSALVLVNPATSFDRSLGGLASVAAATQLLGFFPDGAYGLAQNVMKPLLAEGPRVGPGGIAAMRRMLEMQPPAGFEARARARATGMSRRRCRRR